jgi:hypothetical protein
MKWYPAPIRLLLLLGRLFLHDIPRIVRPPPYSNKKLISGYFRRERKHLEGFEDTESCSSLGVGRSRGEQPLTQELFDRIGSLAFAEVDANWMASVRVNDKERVVEGGQFPFTFFALWMAKLYAEAQ